MRAHTFDCDAVVVKCYWPLTQSVQEAVGAVEITLVSAQCYCSDASVEEIEHEMNQTQILLFDGDDRTNLFGCVPAFYLL